MPVLASNDLVIIASLSLTTATIGHVAGRAREEKTFPGRGRDPQDVKEVVSDDVGQAFRFVPSIVNELCKRR